jgi:hypothetical protein
MPHRLVHLDPETGVTERESDEQREQDALRRDDREGLIGDTDENRNLSGSTTWETLPDQPVGDEEEDLPSGDREEEDD